MKRIVCMQLLLLCVPRAQAMQDGQQVKMVRLQSSDNQTFDISEKEARLFGTLKDMLMDTQDDESPIPVSMAGADLQAMVHDIPWIRKLHAAHNQNSDDIDKILQLDEKIRRERARQSAENIDEIPIYSAETLQATIQRMRSADLLNTPEWLEKNAKTIAELLVSKKFLRELHANPDNNSVQSVFSLPKGLQDAVHSYMPQHWGEHLKIKHDDCVRSVAFSHNNEWFATGSWDGNVRIIEVATGVVKQDINNDGCVYSVAFSPNGQWLATGSSDSNARIIEVATGAVRHVIKYDYLVVSVAFSPNGELRATGSSDENMRIIEVVTGVVRHTIKHDNWVESVAFSPNGEWLATGSGDGNARIIEVATGVVRHTIKHDNIVFSVAFSPNGQWIATGSGDNNARIYVCLTDNFKNAVLASYLKSCQENEIQPNMRGCVSEAVQNHRYQKALKNAFPGLAISGAEQPKWCAII